MLCTKQKETKRKNNNTMFAAHSNMLFQSSLMAIEKLLTLDFMFWLYFFFIFIRWRDCPHTVFRFEIKIRQNWSSSVSNSVHNVKRVTWNMNYQVKSKEKKLLKLTTNTGVTTNCSMASDTFANKWMIWFHNKLNKLSTHFVDGLVGIKGC